MWANKPMEKRYYLKNDVVFKEVFKHKDILKDYISRSLGYEEGYIKDLEVIDPELTPDLAEDKLYRLDILAEVEAGNGKTEYIDIEMQVVYGDTFNDRLLLYLARMLDKREKRGDRLYRDVSRCIVIAIVDGNDAGASRIRPKWHSVNKVADIEDGEVFSDKGEIHIFNLTQIPNTKDKASLWHRLIKADSIESLREVEAEGDEILKEAVNELDKINRDKAMRKRAEDREILLRIIGEEKELQKEKEERFERFKSNLFRRASSAIEKGLISYDDLPDIYGFTSEEIADLKKMAEGTKNE